MKSNTHASRTTESKALKVNMESAIYGTFAEIGAGQEVARHFFQAGKASQTIAKTISAYDMIYSDEIYGKEKNGRYVCESRLNKMLDKEFSLLIRRLAPFRGDKTTFFAYANTVATGSSETPKCHGWMGIRFQKKPQGAFNDIILHVRMQDRHRLQQQEALGVLGVNLVYAAFYQSDTTEEFIEYLVDNLKKGQLIIDVIKLLGEDLAHFDNKKLNLELVKFKLAEAVLFGPNNQVLNISDTVWGKSLIIERGHFRPLTLTHTEVLEKGILQLNQEMKNKSLKSTELIPLLEINNEHGLDIDDYLHRIEIITSQGYHLLISNFTYDYEMKKFFRNYTQEHLAIVMAADHLEIIFNAENYKKLEGGIFEALGKLLDNETRLLVYPYMKSNQCQTSKNFKARDGAILLYRHFLENHQIVDITDCNENTNYYGSDDLLKMIEEKNSDWQTLVSKKTKDYILEKKIWGAK